MINFAGDMPNSYSTQKQKISDMKKFLLFICFMLLGAGVAEAQELVVTKFEQNSSALNAVTNKRYDNTKEVAGVVRVAIAADKKINVTFDGRVVGDVVKDSKTGRYIVYLAKGTRFMIVSAEGYLPKKITFAELAGEPNEKGEIINAEGIKRIESLATYDLDLIDPNHDKIRAIIMPQISIPLKSKDGFNGAYGLMVGFVKKSGAFLRVKSDFNFFSTDAVCDTEGLIDGKMPWYTGKSEVKRWAVTAGYVQRIIKPLYLYAGVGYGQRVLAWERLDGSLVEYEDASYKGIEAEIGAMVRFGVVSVSAGVQTNSFKHTEINVGVGVMF